MPYTDTLPMRLTVSPDGTGDFTTITEALTAVPYDCFAELRLAAGVYREKVFCEKRHIILTGAGTDQTRIVWGDGGRMPHPDGRSIHTFRTYTALFRCEELVVQDLTIENDAGWGREVGQAIAAYVDCVDARFFRVDLLGHQDTLFCAPLPEREREVDGFLGPGRFASRRPSHQYYQDCQIVGDVDFIFGGADALFEGCTIRSLDNGGVGYVAAPSGHADGAGLIFHRSQFVSDAPAGSVYLARPWRPEGRTLVLQCELGAHIHPDGFSPWRDRTDSDLAAFGHRLTTGAGRLTVDGWVKQLTREEAEEWMKRYLDCNS